MYPRFQDHRADIFDEDLAQDSNAQSSNPYGSTNGPLYGGGASTSLPYSSNGSVSELKDTGSFSSTDSYQARPGQRTPSLQTTHSSSLHSLYPAQHQSQYNTASPSHANTYYMQQPPYATPSTSLYHSPGHDVYQNVPPPFDPNSGRHLGRTTSNESTGGGNYYGTPSEVSQQPPYASYQRPEMSSYHSPGHYELFIPGSHPHQPIIPPFPALPPMPSIIPPPPPPGPLGFPPGFSPQLPYPPTPTSSFPQPLPPPNNPPAVSPLNQTQSSGDLPPPRPPPYQGRKDPRQQFSGGSQGSGAQVPAHPYMGVASSTSPYVPSAPSAPPPQAISIEPPGVITPDHQFSSPDPWVQHGVPPHSPYMQPQRPPPPPPPQQQQQLQLQSQLQLQPPPQQQLQQPLHSPTTTKRQNSLPPLSNVVQRVPSSSSGSDEVNYSDFYAFEVIGQGGFGTVYKANWVDDRVVAIKKVMAHSEDLRNEAKLHATLRHRNIIRYFGTCYDDNGCFCIITEFAEHGALYQHIHGTTRTGEMTPMEHTTAINYAIQIAEGMYYLHCGQETQIIHRDLKPQNILMCGPSSNYTLKICDFGTARTMNHTTKMTFAGTFAWMAPEVLRCEPCSVKCDVYSFGVVLWEMLTGSVPYSDMEQMAILWLVTEGGTLPVPDTTPQPFKDILKLCWEVPSKRPVFADVLKMLVRLREATTLESDVATFHGSVKTWSKEITDTYKKWNQRKRWGPGDVDALEEEKKRLAEKERQYDAMLEKVRTQFPNLSLEESTAEAKSVPASSSKQKLTTPEPKVTEEGNFKEPTSAPTSMSSMHHQSQVVTIEEEEKNQNDGVERENGDRKVDGGESAP